ncbi:MAG TPA: BatD family protein [Longimicrobiales bacterium]|nr:BatD family protein [Longimicrobiales bacterium]
MSFVSSSTAPVRHGLAGRRARSPAAGRTALALLSFTLLAPANVSAQDVGVRTYLSPGPTVGTGRPFVLNVEITGSQSVGEEPELPDLGSWAQYLGSSTSSSVQMINGRTSVSLTLQYRFQALREGTFDIPSFEVTAGGQTGETQPLQVTVTASPPPQGGAGAQGGGAPAGELVGPEDVFVTAEATRTRVREGQPLVVEYRLWTRLDVTSYSFTSVPEPQGFWVEDVTTRPQIEELMRNGERYTTAVIRRIALVPTGPGERSIEPVGAEVQVRVRRRDPFSDPFADFFGRSSLLGTTAVATAVLSNPLTIAVEPLPPGRPQPFSGVVGTLALSARIDRDSVATNEAVTLTVSARGEGNIGAVPNPTLGLPSDFEVFPPEVEEAVRPFGPGLSGEKTFEYVVIPRAPGRREIPAITFGYFHDAAGEYRTASTQPIPLTVSGTAVEGGRGQIARGGVAQLREDIRFIHLGTESLRPAGRVLFDSAAFWLTLLLPLAGIAGALALRQHRTRLEGDVAYARGRRASRVARKRLAEARRLAATGDARAFYAEVARALRGLVADRLNLSEAGLQTSEVGNRLSERGVDESLVDEARAVLGHCDRQRFAPPGTDPEEKSRFLDRVGGLMTRLDRSIK